MPGCHDKKGEATDPGNWPETFYAGLSDVGRAGQVLCYTVDPIRYFTDQFYRKKIQAIIKACPPGAICLVSDLEKYDRSILTEFDPVKLRGLITEMQNLTGTPCLFAANFENGAWYWGLNATRFPSPLALGATGSPAFAYRQGKITAVEATAQGINWVLAPVVNNASSSRDEAVSSLCFGEDPAKVGEFAAQFVKGVQDAEAAACLKFYPGPDGDAERSPGAEPLKAGIAAGALSVMGNPFSISGDAASGDNSSDACRDILSTEFGFKGIVLRQVEGVEDSALSATVKVERLFKTFVRGQDMVILPDDPDAVLTLVSQMVTMVQVKRLDINPILPSVKKIVLLKDKLNLHKVDRSKVLFTSGIGVPEYTRTAEDIARSSVTLLKNDGNIIPLNTADTSILFANFIDSTRTSSGIEFSEDLLKKYPRMHQINVLKASDPRISMELLRRAAAVDVVVCTFFLDSSNDGDGPRFSPSQLDLLHRVARVGKPCVGISFSSPLLVNQIPEFKAFMTTYSIFPPLLTVASDVLFGITGVSGKLPVTVSARYPSGSGIVLEARPSADQTAGAFLPGYDESLSETR